MQTRREILVHPVWYTHEVHVRYVRVYRGRTTPELFLTAWEMRYVKGI